jgi:phytoene dehydrogenase-like protein
MFLFVLSINRVMDNKESYDAIIIGAGIGGLTCAAMLALKNKKVLLLEKQKFIGGRCSSYKKNGFTVDYGVHVFTKGKKGPLQTPIDLAQPSFDRPLLEWVRFSPGFLIGNQILKSYMPLNWKHFWNYIKTGISFLKVKLPLKDKLNFARFMTRLRSISNEELESYRGMSIKEFTDKFTKSKFVHEIISITADCYAVYFYEHVAAQDYIELTASTINSEGVYYPLGGCIAIPNAYKKIIEYHGGKVLPSHEVESIMFDILPDQHYQAIGVQIKNSDKKFYSHCIVSNASWKELLHLIPQKTPQIISEYLQDRIDHLVPSNSAVIVHVALDKHIVSTDFLMKPSKLTASEIFQTRQKGEWVEDVGAFIPIVSNLDPNLVPKGKQLVLFAFPGYKKLDEDASPFHNLAIQTLQKFCTKGVNVVAHIDWIEIFGPKELRTLFGEDGAIIAAAQKIGQVRGNRLDNRTEIKGLYHCGDDSGKDIFGVGTELAALSGQKCATFILEDLF